uniref:Probable RNA 2'-phosphotransferase n=1 Tax=Fervidicoccus fontis TaxID=683846 RepID=A0A7J3ZJX1_9CREN
MKGIYKCIKCGAYTESRVHCGLEAQLLLDGSRRERLSKLISFILRHRPEEACVSLDPEGWVLIDELVIGIKTCWRNRHRYSWVAGEHVLALARLDCKGRFEVSDDRAIRARYGHSRTVASKLKLEYLEDAFTRTLFHGTQERFVKNIIREGIRSLNRAFVHLSLSIEDACNVGRRHGPRPVVLVVDADCIRKRGYSIYFASNTVRLSKAVPPECIRESLLLLKWCKWYNCYPTS